MTPHEPDCLCTLCAREMREELKRLRGALEWYAHGCSTYDDGKAAREALSQKGAENVHE